MSKRKIETGRSMVEMLGVLSIIGVLSIGGIAGYSVLLKKHEQNQVDYEKTIRAYAVSTQMMAGQDPSLSGFSEELPGGKYSITLSASPSKADAFELVPDKNDVNVPSLKDEEGVARPFSDLSVDSNDEEFALKITGVTKELCLHFFNMAKNDGIIKHVYSPAGTKLASEDECSNFGSDGFLFTSFSSSSPELWDAIYLIYDRDMSIKHREEVEVLLNENKSECNGNGEMTVAEGQMGCLCKTGYSGEDCSEATEACSNHGKWFDAAAGFGRCLCQDEYTGTYCAEEAGYSPCQTYDSATGKRDFKPVGTLCESAGISGTCNEKGRCVVKEGVPCKGIDACGKGQFCNYGGHMGDYQSGGTPDVCQHVNAQSFEYRGNIYLYNTVSDLRSWCRPADKDKNCTWGYLSYKGAQSWCKSLDAELVSGDLIRENCAEFKSHLPLSSQGQQYWVTNQSVVHMNDCRIQKMSRTDGYAWAGAVVCVRSSSVDLSALTPEEQEFFYDMKEVSSLLKNFTGSAGDFSGDRLDLAKVLVDLQGYADTVAGLEKGLSQKDEKALETLRLQKQKCDQKGFEAKIDELIRKLKA